MINLAKRAVILIVEDDSMIRQNAAEIIEGAEFEVIQAANADEAIVILKNHGHRCRVHRCEFVGCLDQRGSP